MLYSSLYTVAVKSVNCSYIGSSEKIVLKNGNYNGPVKEPTDRETIVQTTIFKFGLRVSRIDVIDFITDNGNNS